jgi:flagellar biosynthesis/type III secretory pathway protein FliH
MTTSSDGITRDISAEEVTPWQPRRLDEFAIGAAPTLEEKLEAARQSGYREGYNVATLEGEKKQQLQTARVNELLRYLGQPLASVDEALKQSMLSLAAEMASHIIAREIGTDIDYYRTQLDQLSDQLPAQVRINALRMRPEKARELRTMREAAEDDTLPEVVDDAELAGDVCLACWQESAVDISLRGRLAAIVQSYCGDNTTEALAIDSAQAIDSAPASNDAQPDSDATGTVTAADNEPATAAQTEAEPPTSDASSGADEVKPSDHVES